MSGLAELVHNLDRFPPSYRARMIAAYPGIAQMTPDEAYYATAEERDAAFLRVLTTRNLRRTHELYLEDLTRHDRRTR